MGAFKRCSAAGNGMQGRKQPFLWHPNLSCRPPAQKDQIPRRDMQPKKQVCHLRVYLETKLMQGCATDILPYSAVQSKMYFQQWVVRQSETITNKLFWIKGTCLPGRCERMGSTVAKARPPLPSLALAPSKWCHLPSKACTDHCFITLVMMALYLKIQPTLLLFVSTQSILTQSLV